MITEWEKWNTKFLDKIQWSIWKLLYIMVLMVPYIYMRTYSACHVVTVRLTLFARTYFAFFFLHFEDNIYVTGFIFSLLLLNFSSVCAHICRMFHLNFYYSEVLFFFFVFIFFFLLFICLRSSCFILDLGSVCTVMFVCVHRIRNQVIISKFFFFFFHSPLH